MVGFKTKFALNKSERLYEIMSWFDGITVPPSECLSRLPHREVGPWHYFIPLEVLSKRRDFSGSFPVQSYNSQAMARWSDLSKQHPAFPGTCRLSKWHFSLSIFLGPGPGKPRNQGHSRIDASSSSTDYAWHMLTMKLCYSHWNTPRVHRVTIFSSMQRFHQSRVWVFESSKFQMQVFRSDMWTSVTAVKHG